MRILDLVLLAMKNKAFWYVASRYGTFAVQFVTSVYLAVELGPYCFGVWSFILLLVNIGTQCNWGISNAVSTLLVQHCKEGPRCEAYEFNAVLMTLGICVVPFLVAFADTVFSFPIFAKYGLGHFSYAVAFIVACYYLNSLFLNIFRVKNRLLEVVVDQSLFPLLILAVIFFFKGRSLLYALVISYVTAMVIALAVFLRARKVALYGRLNWQVIREIGRKGFYLFIYNACYYLIMLSTKMLISIYYPVDDFGRFAFAFSAANAMMLMVNSMLFLFFPKLISILKGGDFAKIRERLPRIRICYISIVNVICYIMIFVYGLLVRFLPKYEASYGVFIAILMTMLIYTLCFGYNIFMQAQNCERPLALFACVALLINVVGVWVAISVFRVPSELSLIGTVVAYVSYVAFVNGYSRHRLGLHIRWLESLQTWIGLIVPFVVSIGMLCAGLSYPWTVLLPLVAVVANPAGMRIFGRVALQIIRRPQMMDL